MKNNGMKRMIQMNEDVSPIIKEAYSKISQEVKDEIMRKVFWYSCGVSMAMVVATMMWFNCEFSKDAAYAYLCVVKHFFIRDIDIEENMDLIEAG